MNKILSKSFYTHSNVTLIARELLGKVLVTCFDGMECSGKIVETEAYRAPEDKACHAYNNKKTKRTRTMFLEGGRAYVYICYGIHHLFNVVTGPEGSAHAILIRALEPLKGVEIMMKRRSMKRLQPQLTNGPGKFTRALAIYRNHDNSMLTSKIGNIWIEDDGSKINAEDIIAGPRVGMSSAGECSNWPWRFRIKENKWTSKPDNVFYNL